MNIIENVFMGLLGGLVFILTSTSAFNLDGIAYALAFILILYSGIHFGVWFLNKTMKIKQELINEGIQKGLYKALDKLQSKHPDIMIQNQPIYDRYHKKVGEASTYGVFRDTINEYSKYLKK